MKKLFYGFALSLLAISGQLNAQAVMSGRVSGNGRPQPIKVAEDGTVQTAGGSSAAVGQGSTTSGQSGTLDQCAVTTAAPTYVNGTTNPLSCDTAGNQRTSVGGTVASAATDSGNPVKIGGKYNSTPPTFTDGQRGDLQLTSRGSLSVAIQDPTGTTIALVGGVNVDTVSAGTASLSVKPFPYVYNGTTWDRQKDATSAAATTGTGLLGVGNLAKFNTTPPTYTDGQFGNMQIGTRGSLNVTLFGANSTTPIGVSNGSADANTSSTNSIPVVPFNLVYNGTTWDRIRTISSTDGAGLGVQGVAISPNSAAPSGITPVVSSVASSSITICGAACNVYAFNITTGASAGYGMLFNATTLPADGTVTPTWCIPLAANAGIDVNWRSVPRRMTTGAVLGFSTTGCFTKTASATAFLAGEGK